MLEQAYQLVSQLMADHDDVAGHGIDHFVAVRDHAIRAVACSNIEDERIKQSIILAAFLHDIDGFLRKPLK